MKKSGQADIAILKLPTRIGTGWERRGHGSGTDDAKATNWNPDPRVWRGVWQGPEKKRIGGLQNDRSVPRAAVTWVKLKLGWERQGAGLFITVEGAFGEKMLGEVVRT